MAGQTVTAADLAQLDDDTRRQVADLWAQENGLADDIERQRAAQDAYLEANPEYAGYRDWMGNVYDTEGGPVAYWESIAQGNEAAATYLEDQRARGLTPAELDRALTTPEAYLASESITVDYRYPVTGDTNDAPFNPARSDPGASTGGFGGSGGSGGQATSTVTDEARIIQDLYEYEAQVAAYTSILIAAGISPAAMNSGSPMMENYIDRTLARYGLERPQLRGDARAYAEWRLVQPQGADTSVKEFLRWKEQNNIDTTAASLPFLLGAISGTGATPNMDQIALMAGLTGGGYGGGGWGGSGSIYSGPPSLPRQRFDVGMRNPNLFGNGQTRLPR